MKNNPQLKINDLETNPQAKTQDQPDYQETPIVRTEHAEDPITRIIEQQSAKIPSHLFLFASMGAMGASLVFHLRGDERKSRFVGMWPTPLLLLGVYNKIVKTFGAR